MELVVTGGIDLLCAVYGGYLTALVLDGAEHFFHGRLVELREAVIEFVQRQ